MTPSRAWGNDGAGTAIALVLLLLFLLVTFGYAYLSAVTGEGHFAARLRLSAQAFRLAESACAEAARRLREEVASPGARGHAFLAAARDGAKLPLEAPETLRLADELYPAARREVSVEAALDRVAAYSPKGGPPGAAAGVVRILARVRLGDATAAVEESRDFKVAPLPAPPMGDLSAELVSRFFASAEAYAAWAGGEERRAVGLTVARLSEPPREDTAPAEGGGALYFAGSSRMRPSDGSAGDPVVTLSGRLAGWRRVKE